MNMYAIAVYDVLNGTQTIVFANAQDEIDALHKQTEYPEWEEVFDNGDSIEQILDKLAQTDTIIAIKRVPDVVLP